MKKNITINIFGQLYAFDEDAYELLKNYEDALRNAFSSKPGGHEISDDIEARIAELLNDLKSNGVEAITIEHVQQIINQIGSPQDIAGCEEQVEDSEGVAQQKEEERQEQKTEKTTSGFVNSLKNKRLYRDANNKMLSGVLGGLAGYFGHDATFWRIGYALLLLSGPVTDLDFFEFFSFLLLVLYVVMAIILPVAKTPEDRLRMKGVEVTPQSLAREMMNDTKQNETRNQNVEVVNKTGGCLLKGCLGVLAFFFIVIPLICLIFSLLMMLFIPTHLFAEAGLIDYLLNQSFAASESLILVFISLIFGFGILLYCVIHAILSSGGHVKPMGIKQRIFWVVACLLWLGLLIASICFFKKSVVFPPTSDIISHSVKEIVAARQGRMYMNNISMPIEDWNYFQNEGFELVRAENCDGNRYTYSGQHFTDDDDTRYFDAHNINGGVLYHARKIENVKPGLYRLTALARADINSGNAVCVFARTIPSVDGNSDSVSANYEENNDSLTVNLGNVANVKVGRNVTISISDQNPETLQFVPVPANGDRGNFLKSQLEALVATKSLPSWVGDDYDDIIEANHGEGFGWSIVAIDSIRVENGQKVEYGITTIPEFNGGNHMDGKWFSACEFHLERISDK